MRVSRWIRLIFITAPSSGMKNLRASFISYNREDGSFILLSRAKYFFKQGGNQGIKRLTYLHGLCRRPARTARICGNENPLQPASDAQLSVPSEFGLRLACEQRDSRLRRLLAAGMERIALLSRFGTCCSDAVCRKSCAHVQAASGAPDESCPDRVI